MNSENDKRYLYNSRIIDTYIKLIKSKYSYVNVGELLSYAGMKPYEVADQGHWFTQEQIDRFYERLVKLTKNDKIAREAGRYAASPEAIGAMRQYFLGLVGPATAYKMAGESATNFTRSSIYESRKLAANKFEITVTPRPDINEKQFQCENRTGFFEAVAMIFNNRLPRIEHPECLFSGGKVCRYIVHLERTSYDYFCKLRNYSTLLLIVILSISLFFDVKTTLETGVPLSAVFILLLSIIAANSEKTELKSCVENTRDSIDKLLEQININYNNALLTNEIGQALSKQTNLEGIINKVVQVLEERLDYDRGLILLANQERTVLELRAGFGYSNDHLGLFEKVSFHLDRPESKGMFVVSFRELRPYLINDLDDVEEALSARSLAFAKKLGTQSFICCPIICEDKSVGVLAVDNVKTKRPLVQSDMSLLMGIASVIGISIRNAELIEASVRQFNSVLQVLAASIDARDSLTAGHSEKVTEYALGICRELNLSRDYCEMIRVAALLHDYGKIGVPDAILKKEGRLTAEEYEIVKTHSEKTFEILSQINFEGVYCEVPEIAASHHERVDGNGYPKGIKGKDIPLGAKIISVADYFEAITAKRHYRDPMELDEAFRCLRDGIGTYFERKFVDALIAYYTKTYLEKTQPPSSMSSRREPRVPFQTEVSLRVAGGEATKCLTGDLSTRGMFVVTENLVAEGLPVELSMAIPSSGSSLIEARGRVVWVNNKSQPKKPNFPAGFGVELLELKDAAEEALMSFVNSYIPANCPRGNN